VPAAAAITYPPELGAGCACGLVDVKGTANDPDGTFSHYRLAYRRIRTPTWTVITDSDTPVIDIPLAIWDTTGLPTCAYTLRLRVYDQAEIGCSSGDRHYTDYMTSVFVNLDCRLPGDMNCDGLVNSFDIDPFVLCLTTGNCDCPD
jgi:hypothetical protein